MKPTPGLFSNNCRTLQPFHRTRDKSEWMLVTRGAREVPKIHAQECRWGDGFFSLQETNIVRPNQSLKGQWL